MSKAYLLVICLLSASFTGCLYDTNSDDGGGLRIVINVPNEKYEERVVYDINGSINFESTIDTPLQLGLIDNEMVINELDMSFEGEMRAGIGSPVTQTMDGYGEVHAVFNKYLEISLDDIDGIVTEEGSNPAQFENAQMDIFQYQFVHPATLEIIRSDIESNTSYSDTLTGEHWYWESETDWVPRNSNTGLLPHGPMYVGKTLSEGSNETVNEEGLEFNLKVENGEKINGVQTALLKIETSYISEPILGYVYQYDYSFHFYMSEMSSLPLKFEMNLLTEASSPSGKLFDISMQYSGKSTQVYEGFSSIPRIAYVDSKQKRGEFENWDHGAPARGGSSGYECGIDSDFTLQTGINAAKENISSFDNYVKDQEAKNKPAFVTKANYTTENEDMWNFTIAHSDEQTNHAEGWSIAYNQTTVSGEEITVDNPVISKDDFPEPLTMCSAEEILTSFDEIASWSINEDNYNVDYAQVKLILGQNLISKKSSVSPIMNFEKLNLINIISDLDAGNLDLNDYSKNDEERYSYFLERKGEERSLGYEYLEQAGVDAKDGLVLFNLQARKSS